MEPPTDEWTDEDEVRLACLDASNVLIEELAVCGHVAEANNKFISCRLKTVSEVHQKHVLADAFGDLLDFG
jgi:hypothetical protein